MKSNENIQEAYGFKIGDVVEYTNPQGVKFSPRTVTGFREKSDYLPDRLIFIDDNCPWMAVAPSSLTRLPKSGDDCKNHDGYISRHYPDNNGEFRQPA